MKFNIKLIWVNEKWKAILLFFSDFVKLLKLNLWPANFMFILMIIDDINAAACH